MSISSASSKIYIGGNFTVKTAQKLLECIQGHREYLYIGDYGDEKFSPVTIGDLIKLACPGDLAGNLVFTNDDISGGRFQVLEEFLEKHNIEHVRYSGADSQCGPMTKVFRPGMERPKYYANMEMQGEVYPRGSAVQKALDEISKGNITQAVNILQNELYEDQGLYPANPPAFRIPYEEWQALAIEEKEHNE